MFTVKFFAVKLFVTFRALKLVCVRMTSSNMIMVIGPSCEPFVTILADHRAVTSMASDVDDQIGICLESLLTARGLV